MAVFKFTTPEAGQVFRKGSDLIVRFNNLTTRNFALTLRKAGADVVTVNAAWDYRWDTEVIFRVPDSYTAGTDYTVRSVSDDSGVTFDVESSAFTVAERREISDLSDMIAFRKRILVEIKAAIELPTDIWTAGSTGGDRYYATVSTDYPEIIGLKVNGTVLLKVANNATDGSLRLAQFSNNPATGLLNIRPDISGFDPTDTGTTITAYVWLTFGNGIESHRLPGAYCEHLYMPYLDESSIPAISLKVADFYTAAVSMNFGNIQLLNDGWWWRARNEYILHNKEVYIKVGEEGDAYQDYVTVFPGRVSNPVITDTSCSIEISDQRAGLFGSIPAAVYSIDDYPDMDTRDNNKPRPILFGTKKGIIPACTNKTTFVYEVSQTVFTGGTYALNAIDAVYLDGVRIYVTTNYTVSLSAGTITLLNDPGDQVVTVDAQGIKCGYNFATGAAAGTFTENVADILFFALREVAGIALDSLDLPSFAALQTKRTQRLGEFVKTKTRMQDFIRSLQSSALFHFIPTLYGGFTVRYYDRADPVDALHFQNVDLDDFQLADVTADCFRGVILKYDRDIAADTWKNVVLEDPAISELYDQNELFEINTLLVNAVEADALAQFYFALFSAPTEKISGTATPEAMGLIPTDKVWVSRSTHGVNCEPFKICEERLYLILEVRKQISGGRVPLLMIRDSQAQGQGVHADIPYGDSHGDTHTDVHSDAAHADTHGDGAHSDTHGDAAHVDSPHIDNYGDYDNKPYVDSYDDYSDIPHVDFHGDSAHEDAGHVDGYSDAHSDVLHTDGYNDTAHGDSHTDTYSNIAHIDSHTDGHTDTYTDSHTDEHNDTPHVDSET